MVERQKTGVQMIKARRGKLERHQTLVQGLTHAFMRLDFRAVPEAAKKHITIGKQIPLAFKKNPLRDILDDISLFTEKLDERWLFPPALGVTEVARDKCFAAR